MNEHSTEEMEDLDHQEDDLDDLIPNPKRYWDRLLHCMRVLPDAEESKIDFDFPDDFV
jgi:hypothetical protein